MAANSEEFLEVGSIIEATQMSPQVSRPQCVVKSLSGWLEEDEPTNPKDATATPSCPNAVRMDMIDDYEEELANELVEQIGKLTTTDVDETDQKGMLATARSRDLYKKHMQRVNAEQQKARSENKKMMRSSKLSHPHREEHEQRGSYTGSLEEQRRAGCKIVSKKHTVDLEDDAELEEAQMMALLRMKQLGRQSWQNLDDVGSSDSPSSKLDALEHGVPSQRVLK